MRGSTSSWRASSATRIAASARSSADGSMFTVASVRKYGRALMLLPGISWASRM